ncbi:ABC transporter substrate-binding protein [Stieleria marina]|uniref:ABC transporter substrate-binding protein n=1 Tax=Stieleria marina TaxID=1930275 RepID=UPI003AF3D2BB
MTNRQTQGEQLPAKLNQRVRAIASRCEKFTASRRPSVVLLEWIDPPFSAGHWNPELVRLAGGDDAIGVAGQHSVGVTWDQIVAADPDVIVLACCGFDVDRIQQDIPILESSANWNSLSAVIN